MSEPLRVALCGPLAVARGSSQIEGQLAGHQGRDVFGFLVLNRDTSVSRDELIALLWPERAPRSPEAALNTVFARLRRALGPGVLVGRSHMHVELPPGSWVDTEAAAQAADRADSLLMADRPEDALDLASTGSGLLSAPLMPDVSHPAIDHRRLELAELAVRLCRTAFRCGMAVGGAGLHEAERAARRLIELEPYRESGYASLMEVCAASGDIAMALVVYEQLCELLRNELGIPPSATIAALHAELLRSGCPDPGAEPVDAPEPGEPASGLVTALTGELLLPAPTLSAGVLPARPMPASEGLTSGLELRSPAPPTVPDMLAGVAGGLNARAPVGVEPVGYVPTPMTSILPWELNTANAVRDYVSGELANREYSGSDDASLELETALRLAHAEATEQIDQTVDLLNERRLHDPGTHCAVLLALGHVSRRVDGRQARATFEAALQISARCADRSHFAEAVLGIGGSFFAPRRPKPSFLRLLEAAMPPAPDGRLRALLLAHLAEQLSSTDLQRSQAVSAEALALARSLGDSSLIMRTLLSRHAAQLFVGELADRIKLLDEQLERGGDGYEPELELLGLHWRIYDLLELGDRLAAGAAMKRMEELATELQQPLYSTPTMVWQRYSALLDGDFARVEQLSAAAAALNDWGASDSPNSHDLFQRLALVEFLGGAETLAPELVERLGAGEGRWTAAVWYLAVLVGDTDAVRRYAQAVSPEALAALPRDGFWLPTLMFAARAAARSGSTEQIATLFRLLEPFAERYGQLTFDGPLGSVHAPLARLAAALGDSQRATAHFEAAMEQHAGLESPILVALTSCDYLEEIALGRVPASEPYVAALRDRATRLGGDYGATQISRRLRRLAA